MSTVRDARFWDRISHKYAKAKIEDQSGYERTLERTRALLEPDGRVLELGCGTGSTALRLAASVRSYLATDISSQMIAIAKEKQSEDPVPGLEFRSATAESLAHEATNFNAVLGFNYLHLVRDVPGALNHIHARLAPDGLFISKTPCIADMGFLMRRILLPVMRAIGKAPYVSIFSAQDLDGLIRAAGFDILATESHATKGKDVRSFIVARKQ